jgi:hypothetical protein
MFLQEFRGDIAERTDPIDGATDISSGGSHCAKPSQGGT